MKSKKVMIAVILLLCSFFVRGQFKFMPTGAMQSNITLIKSSVRVYDSARGIVAVYFKDSLIVYDSLATIKTLINVSQSSFEQQLKQNEKYYAAQEILKYVNMGGYVLRKNRKKFNKAVQHYYKINNL